MQLFSFVDQSVLLPAQALPTKAQTRDRSAWLFGEYKTIRVICGFEVLRVHTNGRSFPGRLASSGAGAWFLLGDEIQTSSELADTRALPTNNVNSKTAFTHVGEACVGANSIVNIGRVNPKFGSRGGGLQGEFVQGPPMLFKQMPNNIWENIVGNA